MLQMSSLALKKEAAGSSEVSVIFTISTQHNAQKVLQ
jgi:hypothetical protein